MTESNPTTRNSQANTDSLADRLPIKRNAKAERRRRLATTASVIVGLGLAANAILGNGGGEVSGDEKKRQIQAVNEINGVYNGEIKLAPGVNIRSSNRVVNASQNDPESNIIKTVGENDHITFENPFEATDADGDGWFAVRWTEKTDGPVESKADLADELGWVKMELAGEGLLELNPKGEPTAVEITDNGIVQVTTQTDRQPQTLDIQNIAFLDQENTQYIQASR